VAVLITKLRSALGHALRYTFRIYVPGTLSRR